MNKNFHETLVPRTRPPVVITDEKLKKAGFEDSFGVAGCCTVPTCFGGKLPYQRYPETPCAIIRSMCSISPAEQMGIELTDEQVKANELLGQA